MATFRTKGELLEIVDFRNRRLAHSREFVLNWREFNDGYPNGKEKT